MERKKRGLKIHEFDAGAIIVQMDEGTNVNYFRQYGYSEELRLHNFEQIERFCHRKRSERYKDQNDNSFFRFYSVIKNFSDERRHSPGIKSPHRYNIFENIIEDISYYFGFYANGEKEENERFAVVNVRSFLQYHFKNFQRVICFISAIDNEGHERFTQTLLAFSSSELSTRKKLDATTYISCPTLEELLSQEHELIGSRPVIIDKKSELVKVFFNEEEIEAKVLPGFIAYKCLDPNLMKIVWKNSSVKIQKLINKHFADSNYIPVLYEDLKPLSNLLRILTGSCLPENTDREICDSYKVAHKYEITRALDFFRDVLKKSVCVNNISLIHNLVKTFNDVELRMSLEDFLKNHKENGKFFCNVINVDFQEGESDMDDLRSEHIHNVFNEYVTCDNPFEINEQMKMKETGKAISSIFSQNEEGQLILHLDSDFGKFMCSKSLVFKHMCELCSTTQTDIVPIKENFFGAIKNIYRLGTGACYIKANTIHDIIELYEASNFYCIPPLIEICRNLFKKYICVRNVESIRKLAEMCDYDVDLKTIVESFQKDMDRFNITQEKSKEVIEYTEIDNSLKIEPSEVQYNFYQ